jgi:hypothetical protein
MHSPSAAILALSFRLSRATYLLVHSLGSYGGSLQRDRDTQRLRLKRHVTCEDRTCRLHSEAYFASPLTTGCYWYVADD